MTKVVWLAADVLSTPSIVGLQGQWSMIQKVGVEFATFSSLLPRKSKKIRKDKPNTVYNVIKRSSHQPEKIVFFQSRVI